MSTSSGYYLRRGKSNSLSRKHQTSFREPSLNRAQTNLPNDKSESKSFKKKVLIPRRSRRLNPETSLETSEGFMTPDRLKEFKKSLTDFTQFSTIKNGKGWEGRNFQVGAKRRLEEQTSPISDTSHVDLAQTRHKGKSNKRVIDSNKILNENKNLLLKNTKYCSTVEPKAQNNNADLQQKNNGRKKRQQSKTFDEDENNREVDTDRDKSKQKTKIRYRKRKTVAGDETDESVEGEDLKVTKRNYRQLKTLPLANDLESFAQKNKILKKGTKNLVPSQTIAFLDSKKQRALKFNVFSENDLKFSSLKIQGSLQEVDVDDDVETDDEQLDRACAKVFEDLLEALTDLHGNRRVFKARYFRDTRNAKKRLMSYYTAKTEPNLKPMNTRKRSKLAKSLSSASTSDRSVCSWRSLHEIEEKSISNCSSPKSITSDSSDEN